MNKFHAKSCVLLFVYVCFSTWVLAEGFESTDPVAAVPLVGDHIAKTASLGALTFHDVNGPRHFISNITISIVRQSSGVKVNFSYVTEGGAGAEIPAFPGFTLVFRHNNIEYIQCKIPGYAVNCHQQYTASGSVSLPDAIFDALDTVEIPSLVADVRACH